MDQRKYYPKATKGDGTLESLRQPIRQRAPRMVARPQVCSAEVCAMLGAPFVGPEAKKTSAYYNSIPKAGAFPQ